MDTSDCLQRLLWIDTGYLVSTRLDGGPRTSIRRWAKFAVQMHMRPSRRGSGWRYNHVHQGSISGGSKKATEGGALVEKLLSMFGKPWNTNLGSLPETIVRHLGAVDRQRHLAHR